MTIVYLLDGRYIASHRMSYRMCLLCMIKTWPFLCWPSSISRRMACWRTTTQQWVYAPSCIFNRKTKPREISNTRWTTYFTWRRPVHSRISFACLRLPASTTSITSTTSLPSLQQETCIDWEVVWCSYVDECVQELCPLSVCFESSITALELLLSESTRTSGRCC